MLMIFIQEIFPFLIIKTLLRNLTAISVFDFIFLIACITATNFGAAFLNVYFSLLMLVMYIFFTWWYIRSIDKAFCVSLQVFIWMIVLDHISEIIAHIFKYTGGYLLVFTVLGILSIVFLNIFLNRTTFEPTFEREDLNKITAFLLLVIYLYIILGEGWQNQFRLIFSNLIVLLVVIGSVFALYMEYLKNVKTKYEVQQKSTQIKNDTRYMSEIETHYNELRRFRHDYQNMMLSINEYLKTHDLDGLQQYYSKNIEPVTKRVSDEQYNLEDLSQIKVKSVKSILFSKLSHAQSEGIKVHFDLKEQLEKISVNELDLDIALGIILDNATEAVIGHKNAEIMSAIFIEKNSAVFLVQNTVFEELPPLWKLKTEGYSTKGKNRGLGLSNLSKIVNRNDNMILETRVLGSVFLQRLTIKSESEDD
ncbi:sensor histidine kinase [Lactiplantibacillus plantarum]|uniref:sensor histidine kinase n=2 Tax=Lactiplantibacillus plantarum TaxID=1590 RepID=UPI000930FEEA|nr:GHKL domain-containing protein [Lactiplantibacillus plantarum]MDN7044342.1 GHKL domain-containing protein [Lactiplantibacillus plantarum]